MLCRNSRSPIPYSCICAHKGMNEGIFPICDACTFAKENDTNCKGKILQWVEHNDINDPSRQKKMYFLVHKEERNWSIWGPSMFLLFVTKHLVKNIPTYVPNSFVFCPHPTILRKEIHRKVKNLYRK